MPRPLRLPRAIRTPGPLRVFDPSRLLQASRSSSRPTCLATSPVPVPTSLHLLAEPSTPRLRSKDKVRAPARAARAPCRRRRLRAHCRAGSGTWRARWRPGRGRQQSGAGAGSATPTASRGPTIGWQKDRGLGHGHGIAESSQRWREEARASEGSAARRSASVRHWPCTRGPQRASNWRSKLAWARVLDWPTSGRDADHSGRVPEAGFSRLDPPHSVVTLLYSCTLHEAVPKGWTRNAIHVTLQVLATEGGHMRTCRGTTRNRLLGALGKKVRSSSKARDQSMPSASPATPSREELLLVRSSPVSIPGTMLGIVLRTGHLVPGFLRAAHRQVPREAAESVAAGLLWRLLRA